MALLDLDSSLVECLMEFLVFTLSVSVSLRVGR